MDCLFCKITSGELPSETVYEDDIVRVFLDIKPVSNGHMLVVPKKHFENALDIDDETLLHIRRITLKMYDLLKEKLGADGLTLCQNNNYGQAIKHYHLHLIPRYENDDTEFKPDRSKLADVKDVFDQLTN